MLKLSDDYSKATPIHGFKANESLLCIFESHYFAFQGYFCALEFFFRTFFSLEDKIRIIIKVIAEIMVFS